MQLSQVLKEVEILDRAEGPSGNFERNDVLSICYDSKKCKQGSLFVAIAGMKTDGHRFIENAIKNGACFIIHERAFDPPAGITAIRVRDSRRALGQIGRNFFSDPSSALCLIAVVGTNGKTTTTYLLESILQNAGCPVGVLGTVNYRYGKTIFPAPNTTPESFEMQRILREMADNGVTHCIAEVSSHAIALHRVDDCAFDMGIFTNLTQDHLDYHKTMENYFHAKQRFFSEVLPAGAKKGTGAMVINGDDPWGQRIIREAAGKYTTYGINNACHISAKTTHFSLEGITAKITSKNEEFEIAAPLMGKFNLYNILAAVAASLELGIPAEAIQKGLALLPQVPGRLEKVNIPGQPSVFVDYAHTDDALRRVLENLIVFRRGRLITVFGCGGDRDRGKRPLMGEAAALYSDLTIVTSDNPRSENPAEIIKDIEKGINLPKMGFDATNPVSVRATFGNSMEKKYIVIPDRSEAIFTAIALAEKEDIVLIAGKGHEDYQIIGDKRFPFDDRDIARRALANRRYEEKTV
ncbi:MAG: UDP-N-acetylmuramoyl-L-alanyl-D-glutamate--2,6-diaminopimelate ligase [Syntrophales bacterium]|jgi:UDP-N-acetylmuramoyl-L-alanyl-D-glutamate--2,6-diaminopimelate ligase|nr:UDP-N-acetylmuramoyl-L-alanyl-D-glutamate--2,6-diaminopimelate ligase [Syntrophales bacterium]